MYTVLQQFGSYLGFTNFMAGLLLAAFQAHTLQKSFIKKLYSSNPENADDDNVKNAAMFNEGREMRLERAIT